jgi:hypothetical protein
MKKKQPRATTRRRTGYETNRSTNPAVANDRSMAARSELVARRAAVIGGPLFARAAPFPRPASRLQEPVPVVDASTALARLQAGIGIPDREPLEICNGIERKLLQFLEGRNPVLVTGRDTGALSRSLLNAGCLISIGEAPMEAARVAAPFASSSAIGETTAIAGRRKVAGQRFDAIAVLRSLEHESDPVRLLTRLGRHLTSDGCVVAAVPNITHGSVRLRLLSGQSPLGVPATGTTPLTRFYDSASVREVFERAGFAITQFERHTETFDGDHNGFDGAPLPKELVADLMRDEEALTAAFIVVAHRLPLTGRVMLELRMRELAQTHRQDHRLLTSRLDAQTDRQDQAESAHRSQQERLDVLDRSLERVSSEAEQLKRIVDASLEGSRDPGDRRLQKAHESLRARQADVDVITRQLKRLQYEQSIRRIRALVDGSLPKASVVLVVSKGDARLLDLHGRTGWHFLQNDAGVYAGHHPADSAAAIDALESLQVKGAEYLVFPWTTLWWLDHYAGFRDYLNQRHRVVLRDDRTCVIYSLVSNP